MACESMWSASGGITWIDRIAVVFDRWNNRLLTWHTTTWHGRRQACWRLRVCCDLCLVVSIGPVQLTQSQGCDFDFVWSGMVNGTRAPTASWRQRCVLLAVAALLLPVLSGCRLMVAAGKMVMGDPVNTSAFEFTTGTDLKESGEKLLIICSAPHGTLLQFPSVQLDIVDRITLHLKSRDIQVVSSDDVATWYDDNGEWGDFSELAKQFESRYVLHVELRTFSFQEPSSPDLMRGRSEGTVTVYRFDDEETGYREAIFEQNLRVKFPETYPVPRESKSEETFVENLLDRISLQVSQMLYDHRLTDTMH